MQFTKNLFTKSMMTALVMIGLFTGVIVSVFAGEYNLRAIDLIGTFDLSSPRTPETHYYRMTSVLSNFALNGDLLDTNTYQLTLKAEPVNGSTTEGVRYTTGSFTVQFGDAPVVSIPALNGWSYLFTGNNEQGQVLGIAHSQFENVVDSAGIALPADKAYFVYNTYIDFHAFCNVFAEPSDGKGIQDLTHIGQKIVHDAAFSEPSTQVGTFIKEGSVYKNGEITLAFNGASVVDGQLCAIVRFDSGQGSFKMLMEPMPDMNVKTVGYSHYKGDLYIDLASRWVRKVVMDEMIFSETNVPMPDGKTSVFNNNTERHSTIEIIDQAAFEQK